MVEGIKPETPPLGARFPPSWFPSASLRRETLGGCREGTLRSDTSWWVFWEPDEGGDKLTHFNGPESTGLWFEQLGQHGEPYTLDWMPEACGAQAQSPSAVTEPLASLWASLAETQSFISNLP